MKRLILTCILIAIACGPAMSDEAEEKVVAPGFRPECEGDKAFLKSVGSGRIAVLPVVIRLPPASMSGRREHREVHVSHGNRLRYSQEFVGE